MNLVGGVGSCQAVFEMSVEYSKIREQFGVPIGRFQRVQDHIVRLVNHFGRRSLDDIRGAVEVGFRTRRCGERSPRQGRNRGGPYGGLLVRAQDQERPFHCASQCSPALLFSCTEQCADGKLDIVEPDLGLAAHEAVEVPYGYAARLLIGNDEVNGCRRITDKQFGAVE